MKPTLICIIGESGSGKSMIAEAIRDVYKVPTLLSYTDRPRRDEADNGHIFLSAQEFDKLNREDMIAYTEFGSNRYCCLKQDVGQVNTYVIDEFGYKHLLKHHVKDYRIVSIRVYRPYKDRLAAVGQERIDRDKGKFIEGEDFFDWRIPPTYTKKQHVIDHALIIVDFILNPQIFKL